MHATDCEYLKRKNDAYTQISRQLYQSMNLADFPAQARTQNRIYKPACATNCKSAHAMYHSHTRLSLIGQLVPPMFSPGIMQTALDWKLVCECALRTLQPMAMPRQPGFSGHSGRGAGWPSPSEAALRSLND